MPRNLFTDRGTGMRSPLGMVAHTYAGAVTSAGFRLNWRHNAEEQAPDMGDLLLHETAVAWFRGVLGPGSTLPRTLFTDRGTGMYSPLGMVVHAYDGAAASAGFNLYRGDNAEEQSPDMCDLLLHDVAVAWFRGKMRRTKPTVVPWEETRAQWAARAARCVKAINSEYNAKGLCAEFPARLRKCMENEGERLAK